ncbi:MAG: insulinase family protein, partial [Thermoplasmata archaeon]|nr:insulinase family protein [Thermoplasmata archaeon]
MSSANDPRIVRSETRDDGLEIARQAAPAGAESFAASFVGPSGWAYDPEGAEGTALIASLVGASAAGDRDRVALARFLDQHGATLTRRLAPETTEYTVWGPQASFEPLLSLLADVVLRPRFEPSDLARVRRQTFERQLREQAQPGSRAEKEFLGAIYPPGHPYRSTGLGTRRSVARVGRPELKRFHRAHASPDGALVVVTGRPSLAETVRTVGRAFDRFPTERAIAPPTVPRARPIPERAIELPMAGRSQVEIRVGAASIARSDPRYPAAFLANEVLGGGLLSRMFQKIREESGLAYHASSDLESMRWGGYWLAHAGTGPERLRAAHRLVQREIERIRTQPIPRPE